MVFSSPIGDCRSSIAFWWSSISELHSFSCVSTFASAASHFSASVDPSPYLSTARSTISCILSTASVRRSCFASSLSRTFSFFSISLVESSKDDLSASICLSSVLVDWIMFCSCFLYSASPSMPIRGPIEIAMCLPQSHYFLKSPFLFLRRFCQTFADCMAINQINEFAVRRQQCFALTYANLQALINKPGAVERYCPSAPSFFLVATVISLPSRIAFSTSADS